MAVRLTGTGRAYTTLLAAADSIRLIGSLTEDEIIELTDSKNYDYTNREDLNFNSVTLNGWRIIIRPSIGVRFTITLDPVDPYNVSLMTFTGARVQGDSNGGLYLGNRLEAEDMLFINDDPTTQVFNNSTTRLTRCVCIAQPAAAQNFRMSGGNPSCWARATTFINGIDGIRAGRASNQIDNCSIFNCTNAYDDNGVVFTGTVRNNVAYDSTVGFLGAFTGATASNNASQDGTQPGTSGVTLVGNPFDANKMTPTSGGQLDLAGISIAEIMTDVANNQYNIGARAIGSNEVTGVIIPPSGIEILRRRRM